MKAEQFKTLKSGQSVALILKVKNKNDFDQTVWTDVPGQSMWIPKERLQPVGLHLMEEVLGNMPEWHRLDFQDAIAICSHIHKKTPLPEEKVIPFTLCLWRIIADYPVSVVGNTREIEKCISHYSDDIQNIMTALRCTK